MSHLEAHTPLGLASQHLLRILARPGCLVIPREAGQRLGGQLCVDELAQPALQLLAAALDGGGYQDLGVGGVDLPGRRAVCGQRAQEGDRQ